MFEGLIEFIEMSLFSVINQIAAEETQGMRQVEHIVVLLGEALISENKRLQARINQLLDRLEAVLKQTA
ncbi:MAG: hypothetical protein WAZ34_05285 [Rhodocyclaceae bacterium]